MSSDSEKETADSTIHGDLSGDRLYQVRARKALPILVRQAKAQRTIYYSELAPELDMFWRNLGNPLGTIADALFNLNERWGADIPLIQSLVINKSRGIPGPGFEQFLKNKKYYQRQNLAGKKEVIKSEQMKVFKFDRWDKVLSEFGLAPVETSKWAIIPPPRNYNKYGKGGESRDHKIFKEYIARNPSVIGLKERSSQGEMEHSFPSGDQVDILFTDGLFQIGVEVKSRISSVEDIARGIYQCVKYKVLIEAEQMVANQKPNAVTILVLEDEFPKDLIPIRNTLGINVKDKVKMN